MVCLCVLIGYDNCVNQVRRIAVVLLVMLGLFAGFRLPRQRQDVTTRPSAPAASALAVRTSAESISTTAAAPQAALPTGQSGTTAAPTGRVTGTSRTPPLALHPPDPAAVYPVLAARDEPAKGTNGLVRRVKLVKADDFKYPLWRVEETLTHDPVTGQAVTRNRQITVADHMLVQLADAAPPEAIQDLARRKNLTIRRTSSHAGLYLLASAAAGLDTVPDLIRALSGEPLVRFAEPDSIVSTCATLPNDPSFSQLWGLNNTGQSGGTADADIDAPEAWDLGTGSTSVVVGVIDTGVDYTHPDLAANIWSNPVEVVNGIDDDGNGYIDDVRGWDFYAADANPMDENGHGTHVSGTIGAVGNNGLGVVGVNWRCSIMPLRFLGPSGSGATSDAIDALYYALGLRQRGVNVRVTNNSWGGAGNEQALEAAISANATGGILFAAAAGNYGTDNDASPFYPASYPESNIIAVAATDSSDGLAYFSQYGLTSVDLGAPGVSIFSTLPNGQYGLNSGTSMATPHVSGVLALMASLSPDSDAATLRHALLAGVDRVPSLTTRTVSGGRLNAFGAIRQLAHIEHTPLGDTYNTGTPYIVEAAIMPAGLMNTNAVQLFWNADGSTNAFTTAAFTRQSGETWTAQIPPQPFGRQIWYWIAATTTRGDALRDPPNAPASLYHFKVVTPVALSVFGSPDNYGTVTPDYGFGVYPSGVVIQAQASSTTVPDGPTRWRCSGWTGMGSVPMSGTACAVTVTVRRTSAIEWQWTPQYALAQTSSVPGLLASTTWWDEGARAATVTAAPLIAVGSTNYAFAFWRLDGLRHPDDTNVALYTVSGIPMTAAHSAVAVYLPETQDADGDGLADWWELFYFGSTNASPTADDDGDGASNLDEFRDRCNPRDPASRPAAPVIAYVPLASPQVVPAPYEIDATVTDNFRVASVTLQWSRSGGPDLATNMTLAGTNGRYQAFIPAPGTNGDTFFYSIRATDPMGNQASSGPYVFRTDYPIMQITPATLTDCLLLPDTITNRLVQIANAGSTVLAASLQIVPAGFADDMEGGTNGWTHWGAADLWRLTTQRCSSASTAWYCGDPVSRTYGNNAHARLDTRAIFVPPKARLTFNYWIESELDTRGVNTAHCWDGGLVEVSTNQGQTFAMLTPVGGYPYAISGWSDSPWADGTRCFAGTGGWQTATFDLAALAGRWIIVQFHFGSDSNTPEEGWYVDDVAVTSDVATNDWISVTPTNVCVPPRCSATVAVTVSSVGIPTGDRGALLRVLNNAPFAPTNDVPAYMQVRSPPSVQVVSAAQTSTNGSGWVTISNTVADVDGDPCSIEYLWSTNAGTTWLANAMVKVSAAVGTPSVNALTIPQVGSIAVLYGTNTITNLVAAAWNTQTGGATVGLAPDALVRCRAWDGTFWSAPVTSQPFLVDNQGPTAPPGLTSTTHAPGVWSTNPVVGLAWAGATDAGAGVIGYRYGLLTDTGILGLACQTTALTVSVTANADGTNWQAIVQAVDAYGNLGQTATLGRYWIDTTPPAAAGATVTVARAPGGNYVLGTALSASWSGFTDGGSGVTGYYVSLTNNQGTATGQWTDQPTAVFTNPVPDATNRVYVWARDGAGLIGPAASAAALVLSPGGDWDGDGIPNAAEAVAGTDPLNPASVLRLQAVYAADTGTVFVVRWPGVTNRFYGLSYRDSLWPTKNDWIGFDDATNLSGVTGFMIYTDRNASAGARFYRVSVQQAPQP